MFETNRTMAGQMALASGSRRRAFPVGLCAYPWSLGDTIGIIPTPVSADTKFHTRRPKEASHE